MQNETADRREASVVKHLENEGVRFSDAAKTVFVSIDQKVPAECRRLLLQRDGAAKLTTLLPRLIPGAEIAEPKNEEIWHLCGLYYFNLGRNYEALAVFSALYDHMLDYQLTAKLRLHKGTPLVRMSECHARLDHPVHSKRYLMLTACEDAILHRGEIPAETTGTYFRMVWGQGISHHLLARYAAQIWRLLQEHEEEARFPEWILQELDHEWITEYPSFQEAAVYVITPSYVNWLLSRLGSPDGKALERLAHYLLSSMPGCRAHIRRKAASTDYDVVCTPEGVGLDFRTELGRYFICECKDWDRKADFTALAKFCRVLDSAKCSFGILFSGEGITGEARTTDAAREQLKVFQQRGMVVIVISELDLKDVAAGANFLTMLRTKYEQVRLDLNK